MSEQETRDKESRLWLNEEYFAKEGSLTEQAALYLSGLMHSGNNESPEMVAAIAELYKVIME